MRSPQPSNSFRRDRVRNIRRALFRWYAAHRRMFPWRNTRDPYKILLSEIMLQQTQASRVAEFFPCWLKQFPTMRALSRASTSEVLRAWSGLGYNSRALRFHQLAKSVMQRRPARLPSDPAELRTLPGIGKYTAHAVACFAYGRNVPVVDVNIRRIVSRLTGAVRSPFDTAGEEHAWELAAILLPAKRAYDWNQALMDFGALVCTARSPLCGSCPIAHFCASAFSPVFRSGLRREKKKEPSRKGIPRRLYRGTILKLLHDHPFTIHQIAGKMWDRYSAGDMEWLEGVAEKMCSDGLLKKSRSLYSLA